MSQCSSGSLFAIICEKLLREIRKDSLGKYIWCIFFFNSSECSAINLNAYNQCTCNFSTWTIEINIFFWCENEQCQIIEIYVDVTCSKGDEKKKVKSECFLFIKAEAYFNPPYLCRNWFSRIFCVWHHLYCRAPISPISTKKKKKKHIPTAECNNSY